MRAACPLNKARSINNVGVAHNCDNPVARLTASVDTPIPPRNEKTAAGKEAIRNGFNDGSIHALILNEAGATGISAHDSAAFPESGRGQRHMIIAQAHRNVDVFMQMLGRVNRTGQVSKPRYTQMGIDVPAEKRPMAVLAKKLASLNANTTANAKGGLENEEAVDSLINMATQLPRKSWLTTCWRITTWMTRWIRSRPRSMQEQLSSSCLR